VLAEAKDFQEIIGAMSAPIEVMLKQDQIFGLHACVRSEEADSFAAALGKSMLEFSRGWTGAQRLDTPGHETFFFYDREEDVRFALADRSPVIPVAEGTEILPPRYGPPLAHLLEIGQPESSAEAPAGCDRWGFTAHDVPALLGMASDPELHVASSESAAVWAPLHAMRALGWLRAETAIAPLAAEWGRPGIEDDDFVADEIAAALAAIGPASVSAAAATLADESRSERARLSAARTLARLATAHPAARAAALAALVGQLNAHPVQKPDFNGLLVSALIDAKAVEAEAHIERAFASGRVDEFVAGDFEDVQIELGLKLYRERPPKPNKWTTMGAQLRAALGMPEPIEAGMTPTDPLPVTALPQPMRAAPKVGRNEPCPCGSGKKYKKCCGA
jgi:hypothetical protein